MSGWRNDARFHPGISTLVDPRHEGEVGMGDLVVGQLKG